MQICYVVLRFFFLVYTIRGDIMRTKENKKGISLIVVIVTIIVVIILAAVVILTLSKNNPIESAKEARFKEDVRTFQDELALAVSKEYADAGGHRDTKISASDFEEIKRYIPSFSEKYRDKFVIQDDELRYTRNLDENEKIFTQSLSIKEKVKLLPDEYQQVEYIESTGTQYIDTKYYANVKTRVLFKFCYTRSNNAAYSNGFVFGSANDTSGKPGFSIGVSLENKIYYRNSNISENFNSPNTINYNEIYTVNVFGNSIKINNTEYISSMTLLSINQNYSSYLFARHHPDEGGSSNVTRSIF